MAITVTVESTESKGCCRIYLNADICKWLGTNHQIYIDSNQDIISIRKNAPGIPCFVFDMNSKESAVYNFKGAKQFQEFIEPGKSVSAVITGWKIDNNNDLCLEKKNAKVKFTDEKICYTGGELSDSD